MSVAVNPLWTAIRRDQPNRAVVAVGDRDDCLLQVEKLGATDGRHFVVGPLRELLDFFVDAAAPETQALLQSAAAFERASAGVERSSLDAPSWVRGGRQRDLGVLMCMAALAVAQGKLSAAYGARVQAEIGGLLRASERAH